MKTRFLSTIALFFISISISLAQGHENAAGRTDPLPGDPVPTPPPGCIPPPVPVLIKYILNNQEIVGKLAWRGVSGATGYYVCISKRGSGEAHCTTRSATPVPPYNLYSCIYNDLPIGTYDVYVQSYNSGCSSGLSRPYPVTITGPYVPQAVDPGNDPFALDLGALLDYNGNNEESRMRSSNPEFGSEAQESGIYPNPVNNTMNVSLPFKLSSNAKLLIHDMNGRAVDNLPMQISLEGRAQIETSGMSPGLYVLTVSSGRNHFKQKFVKK